MKLLTHNMLTSKCMKAVVTGYPLAIQARDVKVSEVEFNQDFISRIIPKIDWECLCRAAEQLGHLDDLPKAVIDNYESDTEFLKKAHHALLEVWDLNYEISILILTFRLKSLMVIWYALKPTENSL